MEVYTEHLCWEMVRLKKELLKTCRLEKKLEKIMAREEENTKKDYEVDLLKGDTFVRVKKWVPSRLVLS